MKYNYAKTYLKQKSTLSYLYQKFLKIDKKIRTNLIIGMSMLLVLLVTGFFLLMISLVNFGGNLINEALGENTKIIKIKEGVKDILLPTQKKD